MIAVWQIAKDVILQARRSQFFVLTLAMIVSLVFLFTALSAADPNLRSRIFVESAMTLLWFLHFVLGILFVSESMVAEIHEKSIYFYLVRNVSRFQYLLGKYLGFLLSFGISIGLCGLVVFVCSSWLNQTIETRIFIGTGFLWLEMALSLAVMMFLCFVFSRLLSVFIFIFLFFFASLLEGLVIETGWNEILSYLLLVLPNYKYFSWIEMVVHAKEFSGKYIWFLCGYTFFMAQFYLGITAIQFRRKEL